MNTNWLRQLYSAIAATIITVILCCIIYPLIVFGIAQIMFPDKANGSLIKRDGTYAASDGDAIGSALLGQGFANKQYFHPRPSAAGSGYDPISSGGTNLGPTSDKLLNGVHGSKKADGTPDPNSDFDGIKDLAAAYRTENGLAADAVIPQDAVTRSASGLDPDISIDNAIVQSRRVGTARGLDESVVRKAIDNATDKPDLGFIGEPRVNVLKLNIALDQVR